MKYYVSLLVAVLCIFLLSKVYGQEITPEAELTQTATATETAVASLTTTPTATLTSTDVVLTNTATISPPSLDETYTPTVLSTEAAVPNASPTPVPTSTPTPIIIPNIDWIEIYQNPLTNPQPGSWLISGDGWQYRNNRNAGRALEISDTNTQFLLAQTVLENGAIQIVANLLNGDAHLLARVNGDVRYEARITSFGQINLFRGTQIVATTAIPEFVNSQPHQLRLNVTDSMVWISVDGQNYLTWEDTAPLPPGQIGFSAGGSVTSSQPVRFNNVSIFEQAEQVAIATLTPILTATASATPLTSLVPTHTPTRTITPEGGISSENPDSISSLQPVVADSFQSATTFTINNDDVTDLRNRMNGSGEIIIDLAENGEYTFSSYMSGEYFFGNCALPIVESGAIVTINGNGATLNASATGFRIFCVAGGGQLTLNNLTISNATLYENGGAGLVNLGISNINSVTFSNNSVQIPTSTIPTPSDFYDGYTGGAIYAYLAQTKISTSIFDNNRIIYEDGQNPGGYGGAIRIRGGSFTISNSIFQNNRAQRGGVITVSENSVYTENNSPISSSNNQYLNNVASENGGVFHVTGGGYLNEQNATIAGNSAVNGSVFYRQDGLVNVTVANSNIYNNGSPIVYNTSSIVTFSNNWWGNANGPNSGDLVNPGNINVSPYSPTEIDICPPSSNDNDGDCLTNTFEAQYGFDPNDPYSIDPNDAIPDGEWDSDGDGLTNYEEQEVGTNPLLSDTDGDGLTDPQELRANQIAGSVISDPADGDTDNNGISDFDEDYDNDGLPNGIELTLNGGVTYDFLVPKTPNSDPVIAILLDGDRDLDSDGLRNRYELLFLDPNNPGQTLYDINNAYSVDPITNDGDQDYDGDGLTNVQEFRAIASGINSDPTDLDRDTDNDGISDFDEDYDNDGLPNRIELTLNGGVTYDFLVPKTPDSDPVIADLLDGDRDLDNDDLPNRYEIISDGSGGTIYNIANDDTDGNGTDDGAEDYDNDGLINHLEVRAIQAGFLSDLTLQDTNSNGTDDGAEDYDNDGLPNSIEITLSSGSIYDFLTAYSALRPEDDPSVATLLDGYRDLDGDGLRNRYEIIPDGNGGTIYEIDNPDTDGNGTDDGDEDYDTDGLINLVELTQILDGLGNPYYDFTVTDSGPNAGQGIPDGQKDPDNDLLTNQGEIIAGSDPFNADTDGDLLPDGFEVDQSQTDPTNPNSLDPITNDADADPDNDSLTNYQEYILGTNPREATVLVPSRFDSTVQLSPIEPANADGQDTITITATVRDSAGRALPMVTVDWITTNTNLVITPTTSQTDENGVATAQVTSSVISSGIVEVRANNVVLGRPLLEFVGGNPAVNFTSVSSSSVLPGQSVIGVFEVTNADQLTSQNVEVTATLPFGQGTIVDIQTPANGVTLVSQGANAVTWRIASLAPEDTYSFTMRWRLASNIAQNVQVPLLVEIIAVDDRDTTNNQAAVTATTSSSLNVPSTDQQSDKLDVVFTSNPTQAAIGSAVTLDATITNTSSEDLFNISGALPLLGNAYPNVVFVWPDPARPGYLPVGLTANATMTYTLTENYPNLSPGQQTLTVWGIDSTPGDGQSVVSNKVSLNPITISGAYIDVNITADMTQANIGDTVTFTVNITNSSQSASPASNLQVTGNLFSSPQPLSDVPVGSNVPAYVFTHTVTVDDLPVLTALVQVTGTNFPAREARRTVWTTNQTTTAPAPNLTFDSPPQTITVLSGQPTNLTLFVENAGNIPSMDGTLRVNIPFDIDVDAQLLADGGTYNSSTRVVQWSLGAMNSNAQVTRVVPLMVSSSVPIGTEFIIGAVLSTPDDESNINDNVHEIIGQVELPVLTNVEFNPLNRNWLVANGLDQLSLELTAFDQLGNPLSGQTATFIADQTGVAFNPNPPSGTSDGNGKITISIQAEPNAVGPVNITALLSNGLTATTTITRRDNPVRITSDPAPTTVSIGGRASYRVMVVNTATLDNNATSDSITLSATSNPPLPAEWFTFTSNPLPLSFGEFRETVLNLAVPASVDCATYLDDYEITITAQGSILGEIGQVTTPLTVTQSPPSATQILPNNSEHIASDNVLFSWRSQAITATSRVYYRDQATGGSYTPVVLTQSAIDPRLYSTEVDFSSYATGSVIEWYGEISNGCGGTSAIASATAPRTFTRVRTTTFVDAGYDFTVRDGYNLTQTVDSQPMRIHVQNEDTQSHQILLDVENPYDDLIIGFVGSGSVDQMLTLAPGGTFAGQLRVFTQETTEEVYYLTLRLENDEGDVDRIPLTITIQEPIVDIGVTILSVDDRTMITRARLVNRGDDLTDLTLDVRNEMGIPANIIIQPDIQHTYIRAGETIDIAFVPLSIQETNQAPMSMQTYDPMTGMTMFNQSTPQMMAVPGPYKVVSETRGNEQEIELEGGEVVNECGAVPGSERTIAHECTMPAGSETYASEGWYCTNKPFISIPFNLRLPIFDVLLINAVEVSANFSRGFTGEQLYSHSTTVTLNGSLVGSAIVPNQSQIQSAVPPGSLAFGGLNPTQLLNINSNHSNNNQAHYTVASGFTVTVDYDEHTRTGCFTQAEIDAAMGGTLMCTGDSIFDPPPDNRLDLTLDVDQSELDVTQRDTPYDYEVGDTIPLLLSVDAAALSSDVDTVTVELTVPQELRPSDMAISEEPQSFINQILNFWRNLLSGSDTDQNVTVTADGTSRQLTYIYDRNVIGQQLAIDLDVVGELAGNYTITGEAFIGSEGIVQSGFSQLSTSTMQRQQNGFADASDSVGINVSQIFVTNTPVPTVIPFTCESFVISDSPLAYRTRTDLDSNTLMGRIDNNMITTQELITPGNENDPRVLPVGQEVRIDITRLIDINPNEEIVNGNSMYVVWVEADVIIVSSGNRITGGVMALRVGQSSNDMTDTMSINCNLADLPGFPPTPVPTLTPPAAEDIWYISCSSLRPNTLFRWRTERDVNAPFMETLSQGSPLIRYSQDPIYSDGTRFTWLTILSPVDQSSLAYVIIRDQIDTDITGGLVGLNNPFLDNLDDPSITYVTDTRDPMCPMATPTPVPTIAPTPTPQPPPDVIIPDAGRFAEGGTVFGQVFGNDVNALATVGDCGIHEPTCEREDTDGKVEQLIVDVLPDELEACHDIQDTCQPATPPDLVMVYAPFSGWIVPSGRNGDTGATLIIGSGGEDFLISLDNASEVTTLVRREVYMEHVILTLEGDFPPYEMSYIPVGTLIGYVDPNFQHLDFGVRFRKLVGTREVYYHPTTEELLGVITANGQICLRDIYAIGIAWDQIIPGVSDVNYERIRTCA